MRNRSLPEALVRAAAHPLADGADADLLGRFVQTRDASAFEALVRRHGPMVLGVCRRALGDTPDADDAFQAVWLVLVRKARSISPRGKVGNWLYGVAARTALHARSKNARRRTAQRELPDVPDPRPADHDGTELASAVDDELARLPDRYRAAVVLCELQGRSLKDAAEQAGVPLGTLASRLARGRALLAERLKARGFAAAAVAGWFAAATAPVSARLAGLTAALLNVGPDGVARSVSELTRGVLLTMLANKLKAAGQVVIAVALAAGAVVWAATAGAQPGAPAQPPPVVPPVGEKGGNEFAGRLDPDRDRVVIHPAEGNTPYWAELAGDEPDASRAVLKLAADPKAAVALFQRKLKPLKLSAEEAKKLIADLGNERREVSDAAFDALSYFDPRLALDPDTALAAAKEPLARQRLAAVLVDSPDAKKFAAGDLQFELTGGRSRGAQRAYTLTATGGRGVVPQAFEVPADVGAIRRASWVRATRAVVILEHIRSPEAIALLKELATGRADALPTATAKKAYEWLTNPVP